MLTILPQTNWEAAASDVGSKSVNSMKTMVSGDLKKIRDTIEVGNGVEGELPSYQSRLSCITDQ